MLLGALLWDVTVKAAVNVERDSREPGIVIYDTLGKHVLQKSVTASTLAKLDLDEAHTAPGVSPYSLLAGVPLPQMPVVVNIPAFPSEETLTPVLATKELPIAKADNTIHTDIDNMMKAFSVWTI